MIHWSNYGAYLSGRCWKEAEKLRKGEMVTEEQVRKPDGATHLENEKPDENEIEPAYEPPLRNKEKAQEDDLEEEV